jgi:broad specificity phosphatase PhoE
MLPIAKGRVMSGVENEQDYQIETIERLVAEDPTADVILLIRHSTREDISRPDVARAVSAPLTRQGRDLAWSFGRRVPNARPVKLRFSRIPRCVDTAHFIRRGIIEKGGSCEIVGSREYLEAPFVRDPIRVMQAFVEHGQQGFGREWALGNLGTDVIEDIREAGRAVLDNLLASRENDEPGTTCLYITHDLTIAAFLSLGLDVAAGDFDWPDYLGGPVVGLGDARLTVHYRGRTIPIY